jgi:hypothetical protein
MSAENVLGIRSIEDARERTDIASSSSPPCPR